MSQFPRNARAGQTHKKFGRKYVYSETTETWSPIVPLASKAEIKRAAAVTSSATTFYATAAELPLSNNTTGTLAFVNETNRLYIWSGTGWYNVATITGAGASISGANSSYTLATDGTPTVVTLSQSGLTSPTWSYEVTTGSLGRTATVTQADNVFTITPSTRAIDIGSFGLTFKATDGSNTIVTSSQFTMSNTAPVIGTGPSATYTLAEDGTPTVITLAATDADGHAITWSYEVVSGSLGSTTVTNVGSVFTITPSTDENDAGTFQLRFVASDGAASDTDVAEFTLAFGPNWTLTTQQAKILSSDIYAGDRFGHSVAIDGDTAIVSAFQKVKEGGGNEAGAAYVFTRSGTTWTQQAKLLPNVLEEYDNFGSSVGISGDTVVIGSRGDRSPAGLPWSGSAYIFTRSGTTWTQQARIQPSEVEQSDYFGYSVAIDGDTVVVGAQLEDTGADGAGSAYIYTRSGTTWTQQAKIQASDKQASDEFGFSVAIDGDTVVVGATYEDTGGSDAGAAYVFTRSGTTWTQQAKLLASDRQASDYFGWWVTVDGDTAIVGAPAEDTGGDAAGAAYIFTRSGTTWTQQAKIQSDAAADVWFGQSVSVEGDAMVVSAYRQDTGGANAGAAYIFTRDGTTWTQEVKIQASDAAANDLFGWSVAMSGNTVISGAYNETSGGNSGGAAYIFVAG